MRQGELVPDGPLNRAIVSDKLGQYNMARPSGAAAWLNLSNLI
jgi:hypothetical protein